jgi:hypothetical protein
MMQPDARLLKVVRQNGRAGTEEGHAVLVFLKHLAKVGGITTPFHTGPATPADKKPSLVIDHMVSTAASGECLAKTTSISSSKAGGASVVIHSSIDISTVLASAGAAQLEVRSSHTQRGCVGVTKSPCFPSSPSEEKGATESGG